MIESNIQRVASLSTKLTNIIINTPKKIDSKNGSITYLNSGDWVENMTALEYNNNKWTLFQYNEKLFKNEECDENEYKNTKTLFSDLLAEINTNTNN